MRLNASQQARIKTILALHEAQGRETQANHLAFETECSVDEAKAILAKSPKELPPVDTAEQIYARYNAAHDPARTHRADGR